MKNTFSLILWVSMCLLLNLAPLQGQVFPNLPSHDTRHLLAAEKVPVLFAGSGEIQGANKTYTSSWLQIGYSAQASASSNRQISIFNPEYFSVYLKLAVWNEGDSAQISTARFECAFDTTAAPIWNADSSNNFISVTAFGHEDYGCWKFLPVSDTSRYYAFPLKILLGGYLRLVLETSLEDTCTVNWNLVCEH